MPSQPDASTPPPCDPSPAPAPRLTRATGPKTVAGKARSRANAVRHGMRCQVVEPPDQRDKIDHRVAEWTDALQPTNAVQRWLVARAATASVRLDRCVERENLALEETTADAERTFVRRRRAWARRTGQNLETEHAKAYRRLTSSAFGCDWLIARLDELARDLEIAGGYWSRAEFLRAVALFGIDPLRIPPDHPTVARLYRDVLTADKSPDPDAVDFFLKLDTKSLEPADRADRHRQTLGDRDDARQSLLAAVRHEQARLQRLREVLWAEHDAPILEAACAHARTFDPSPEATLARRYEASQALELHRHLDDFHRARRESDAPDASLAPNELQNGQNCDIKLESPIISETTSAALPASPWRPGGVGEASPARRRRVPRASSGDSRGEKEEGSLRVAEDAETGEAESG